MSHTVLMGCGITRANVVTVWELAQPGLDLPPGEKPFELLKIGDALFQYEPSWGGWLWVG